MGENATEISERLSRIEQGVARINARKNQRQLERLLAQQSTNSVDVVVTPQGR